MPSAETIFFLASRAARFWKVSS